MLGVKQRYFLGSLAKAALKHGLSCPSCGADESDVVSRKYAVTTLRRCRECRLLYRAPTSSATESHRYYNGAYRSGLTTDMPDDAKLAEMKDTGFEGTSKCFDRYIAVLRALGLGRGARLLDFGCSWGYGAWQLQQAGFEVVGFEVSEARAAFAREKMGIRAVTQPQAVDGSFDAIFSAHVLEHVPSVAESIDWSLEGLQRGGLFIAVTPNGSAEFRAKHAERWDRLWGKVHPNFLDNEYYQSKFATVPYFVTSELGRLSELSVWAGKPNQGQGDLSGWELLAIARREALSRQWR